jgi:transcriptional regulator with XRE-family HTH domain
MGGRKERPAEAFGQVLQELRARKGLTQEALAHEVGTERSPAALVRMSPPLLGKSRPHGLHDFVFDVNKDIDADAPKCNQGRGGISGRENAYAPIPAARVSKVRRW